MAGNNHLEPGDDKRGGYSGSTDAANIPPPAKIPSGSVRQSPPQQGRPPANK